MLWKFLPVLARHCFLITVTSHANALLTQPSQNELSHPRGKRHLSPRSGTRTSVHLISHSFPGSRCKRRTVARKKTKNCNARINPRRPPSVIDWLCLQYENAEPWAPRHVRGHLLCKWASLRLFWSFKEVSNGGAGTMVFRAALRVNKIHILRGEISRRDYFFVLDCF